MVLEVFPVLLFILEVREVYSGHSLQYYRTAVSSPGHGLPEYISVGYVDGIEITRYSSDTNRTRPVAPWMKKVEDPEYWEKETLINKNAQAAARHNVTTVMSHFNQSGGFHIFQEMYGCEMRDDGSIGGYWRFGYDGKDFIILDTKSKGYRFLVGQAQVIAESWNNPLGLAGKRANDYLETDCIKWLGKYLEYGKEELQRRVRPKVKVSSHQADEVTKLHCQVYGFYPRDVDVNWKRNDINILDASKRVLPNTDGTYQVTITVEVPPEDTKNYSCHVDHISLTKAIVKTWDPQAYHGRTRFIIIIIIAVLAGAVIALMIYIYITYDKGTIQRQPNRQKRQTSDGHVEEIPTSRKGARGGKYSRARNDRLGENRLHPEH